MDHHRPAEEVAEDDSRRASIGPNIIHIQCRVHIETGSRWWQRWAAWRTAAVNAIVCINTTAKRQGQGARGG